MNKIKLILLEQNKTAVEVATKIGYTKPVFSYITSGHVLPNVKAMQKLCEELNQMPLDLYTEDELNLTLKNKPRIKKEQQQRESVYNFCSRVNLTCYNKLEHAKKVLNISKNKFIFLEMLNLLESKVNREIKKQAKQSEVCNAKIK